MKIGPNDKCHCGSDKKYKKCCRDKERPISQSQIDSLVQDVMNKPKEPFGEGGLLTGRPFIQTVHQGKRVRAVGNRIHLRDLNETFHEFLLGHLADILTRDWILAEKLKNPGDRHLIVQWFDEMDSLMAKAEYSEDKNAYGINTTGNVKALMALAYDFYSLSHCQAATLPKLLNRLKNMDQFQGARYEIAVGGLAARAGFEFSWINAEESHCEFIGRHKVTGQKVAFEAKSHHRSGVLGRDGQFNSEEAKVKVVDHIKEARLQAPEDIPFVIFDDINLPIQENLPMDQKRWFAEINESFKEAGLLTHGHENSLFKDNLSAVYITNFSYHFDANPAFRENDVLVFFHQGGEYSLDLNTINFLKKSAEQYSMVPHKLEERKDI